MKGIIRGQIRFIYWILISIIFVLYVVYLSFSNELISKILNIFILLTGVLVFVGTGISFHIKFRKEKFYLKIKQEKEKNIRDFYRYEKFIDPPDYSLNN
jgi:multisubunit Na+/H+ antiporter MnhC subunit